MAPNQLATLIEQCRISPADDDTITELSLPLTLFDMPWLNYHIMTSVMFYKLSFPKQYMVETVIPSLKASLSRALKLYLPLAGNMVFPFIFGKPKLRYQVGDSISVTFAESHHDYNYLTGYHPRNAEDFYHLLSQLPPASDEFESKIVPLLAIQVTIFPNFGISLGFSSRHVVADAKTMIDFMNAWAAFNKFGENQAKLESGSNKFIPVFNRSMIQNKDIDKVDEILWNARREKFNVTEIKESFGHNKVRATFVIQKSDIQNLKNLVLKKNVQHPVHVSTFTVTCAYVWTCLLKSGDAIGEKIDDNEMEYFISPFDCRARLKPPVPANYFGNCVGFCFVKALHGKLTKRDGFLAAAEMIGEAIRKTVNNNAEGIMKDAKDWQVEMEGVNWKRSFGVNGSPYYDPYVIDYGWGMAAKCEIISIDEDGGMSLDKHWKSQGALEFGLSMPKAKMDAFATLFTEDLVNMSSIYSPLS